MSQMIRSAAVLLGLIALASRAEAQAAAQPKPSPLKAAATEYSFEIRPTLGLVIPLAPSGDVGWDIGGSFRVRPPSWPVGLQLDLIWMDLDYSLFQFTADAFFPFATGSKSFEPYIIAGLGMYDGEFGINAGVGADFAISGSPIGFFAETRFHVVFEPGDNPNLLPINAGVRLRF